MTTAEFPEAFQFLFQPARYKVAYGGRGAAKSQSFARALLIQGGQQPLRILCTRATQRSISDSVHKLLSDQIKALGLESRYTVQKASIRGVNGTEFIFSGLKDAAALKSYENISRCWVEEAQVVPKSAWETLLPSIRGTDSEVWISMNPLLAEDDSHKRWVLNPPPNAVVRKINYDSNPWFPEVLRIEMEHMREANPVDFSHVWLGECKSEIEGAIFAEQLKAARAEKRITTVPLDKTRPVYTFWDLGYGDMTAIWFAQAVDGWYQIVDYLEDSGKTIADYVVALNHRGYLYGAHWLPHDCVDTIIHKKLAGGDRTRSVEQLLRTACGSIPVRVASKLTVVDRINAARTIFSQCRFDSEKCADGIQALSHYQWAPVQASGATSRTELHNHASHGSSAFCTLAVSIKQPVVERKPVVTPDEEYSWMA